jgi:hypothetical protein
MKLKHPNTRQIPKVAIIIKTQGQYIKIQGTNIQYKGSCQKEHACRIQKTYHWKDMANVM